MTALNWRANLEPVFPFVHLTRRSRIWIQVAKFDHIASESMRPRVESNKDGIRQLGIQCHNEIKVFVEGAVVYENSWI